MRWGSLTDRAKLNIAFIERPEPHDPSGLRLPSSSIAAKRLTFRDIFTARYAVARVAVVRFRAEAYHEPVAGLRCAA
jgi:hypothetical protein